MCASVSKPRFSILLPTLRRKLFEATLHTIYQHSQGLDYEIVVVSPFKVEGERIVWVEEKKAGGCIRAFADAYERSTGDIIVAMTDDTIALPGWLEAIDRWIVAGEKQYMPYCIGLNRVNVATLGTVFGKYYGYFPAISRRSIEAAGGWFYDPSFVGNWADPDLGMRVWDAGGRVEYCWEARIQMVTIQSQFAEAVHKAGRYFITDSETFWNKWNHTVPEFVRSRQFRDINADYHIDLMKDRTILIDYVPMEELERRRNADLPKEEDSKPQALVPLLRLAEPEKAEEKPALAEKRTIISQVQYYHEILGFQLWRLTYSDMTTEVMIRPEWYFQVFVGNFDRYFVNFDSAIRWICAAVIGLTPEPGLDQETLIKDHIDVDLAATERLAAMNIFGANCSLPVHRNIYMPSFLGTPVYHYWINGKRVFVAAPGVEIGHLGVGYFLITRLRGALVADEPWKILDLMVKDTCREGRVRPLLRHLLGVGPVARMVVRLALLRRYSEQAKLRDRAIHWVRKAKWKAVLAFWDGAAIFRHESRGMGVGEWKI